METGTHTAAPYHGVVGGEEEPTYRTVSVLALVALFLGLASPLAFAAPLLLIVPLVGVVIAVAAVRQIAANETVMVGRAAALVGLALSVACLAAVYARSAVTSSILSREARDYGTQWFERLQEGDAEGAFRMSQNSLRLAPPPNPAHNHDGPPPNEFDQFRADPVVNYLLSHGGHAQVKYVADVAPGDGSAEFYRATKQYQIIDSHHNGQPIVVDLTLQRSKHDGQMRWIVMSFASDELRPADDHNGHDHSGHDHPHVH